MPFNDLAYIPKGVRRLLIFVLGAVALMSAALCVYYAFVAEQPEIAMVALGSAQGALSALAIVAVVSFSLRMKGAEDVQKVIDSFFIDDLHPALTEVEIH